MKTNFVNSEKCNLDGLEMTYFMHPKTLINKIENILSEVGAETFYSSPDEEVKKAREGLIECFFITALKKITDKDWFLMQPQKDPPDFCITTINSDPKVVTLNRFELVEIPIHCQTFEGMMGILQGKQNKGYSEKYDLLIFINNNKKSKEWVDLLDKQLKNWEPFKTIWVIYLLQYKNKKDLYGSVINKLRPYPLESFKVAFEEVSDQVLSIPNHVEEIKIGDKLFLKPKSNFTKELRKFVLSCKREKSH